MAHYRLSPSHSATWLNCAAALRLSEGIEDRGSRFASEGTAAHELGALCLTVGADADEYLGKTINADGQDFTVDADMARFVQVYLDFVWQEAEGGELLIEQFVDLSQWYGEPGGGTADAIVIKDDTLTVIDLKYGRGVAVSADGNTQLRIYAAGAYPLAIKRRLTPSKIRMVIVQPRVSDPISIEEISFDELNAWVRDVLVPGAKATRDPESVATPTEKGCQWCKAKAVCPALACHNLDVVGAASVEEFRDLTLPPAPIEMTADTLGLVLDKAAMVRQWLDACEGEALRRLKEGDAVPGYKAVIGRAGNRKWAEGQEDAVVQVLANNYGLTKESMYELKLLSPAQISKLAPVKDKGNALLEPFITRSEGAIVLAPASDKRESAVQSAEIAAEITFANFE